MAERVAVAMSGGVDSSVAAALLLEQGHEVVGFTMQIWPREVEEDTPPGLRGCCGLEAIDSARKVASVLGIRHYVLNLREPFERLVIEPFCEEYSAGRTPNPCIRCNTFVKFGPLLRRSAEIEADALATGHYARTAYDEQSGRWQLLRGADASKDQSYSLYGLSQEQLSRAVFPLGEMTKEEVWTRAGELGLPSADRPESQEICFVSGPSYHEYLARRRPELVSPGPIVDRNGRQLGRHGGIAFYTVGQRQGLRVSQGRPLYVIGIDSQRNRLIVGEADEAVFQRVVVKDVNYVSIRELPQGGLKLAAQIRSGGRAARCTARPEGAGARVEFERPQRGVSPGQAAVCYDGDRVILGGVIEAGS